MRALLGVAGVALAIGLAGCGGGGGSGGLSQDLATTLADFQVLDLATGTVEAKASIDASDPTLRDRYLAVRRLPQRSATTGQAAGTFAAQPDETPGNSSRSPCYLAVFELTRAQWRRIAGDEPWTTLQPAGLAGSGGDDLPACGISHARAVAALAAFQSRGLNLQLPDDTTWESAARAGTALFPWGDARDAATIAANAVIAESVGVALGPQAVGAHAAGASGCYDLVGNVAEWTAEGHLRGGAWSDPLSLARPANVREAESDLPLACAGVRVVFRPASH